MNALQNLGRTYDLNSPQRFCHIACIQVIDLFYCFLFEPAEVVFFKAGYDRFDLYFSFVICNNPFMHMKLILSGLFHFSLCTLLYISYTTTESYLSVCLPLLQPTVWRKASTSSGHSLTSRCSFMLLKGKRKLPALEHPISTGFDFLDHYIDLIFVLFIFFIYIYVKTADVFFSCFTLLFWPQVFNKPLWIKSYHII